MDTTEQVIARVRLLLRRVSDIALPDDSIRVELNRLCRLYLKEEDLGPHPRRVKTVEVDIDDNDIDFLVAVNVPEFEATRLEYTIADGINLASYEAQIVPFSAWSRHFDQPYVAAAFYGSKRVRLNLTAEEVAARIWQLSYQETPVYLAQSGEHPPIPSAHISMLEHEAAINLMPQVDEDSSEWVSWMDRTLPIYRDTLKQEKAVYMASIEKSDEPQIVNIRPYNAHRGVRRVRTRGTILAQ